MLIFLEKRKFIIGTFDYVINFLLAKSKQSLHSKIVLPCSLHDLAMQNNKNYQSFYENIDYCTNDSMLLTNYLCHKYKKQIERVYGPELMLEILNKSQKVFSKPKHYFLAPNKKNMIAIKNWYQKKYPKIHAFFDFLPLNIDKQQEYLYLQKIILKKPKIIWVGIGSPKQLELASWLKKHSKNTLIICVGAAFDFISGNKKQAPQWIRKNNLEWLFRLLTEPKRLWRRYLVVIPKYLVSLIWKNL